jgi:single-strand DNA-binding protein
MIMNKAILMGRITKDVELRQTQNGTPVASFTVAINRRFNKEETDYINCVAWKQQAEFVSKYFGKGRMIAVVGSIQTRSWENAEGEKRYATEVVADEVYFTGEKKEEITEADIMQGFAEMIADDEDVPF